MHDPQPDVFRVPNRPDVAILCAEYGFVTPRADQAFAGEPGPAWVLVTNSATHADPRPLTDALTHYAVPFSRPGVTQ